MLSLIWCLRYFSLCLDCDIPILEAFHFTWNPIELEFCKILPDLHAQLTTWGYKYGFDPHPFWNRFRNGDNRTCSRVAGGCLGFAVTKNDSSTTTFSFQIDYPENTYTVTRSDWYRMADGFSSNRVNSSIHERASWYAKFLETLFPTPQRMSPESIVLWK
jgi:hypothetical protein